MGGDVWCDTDFLSSLPLSLSPSRYTRPWTSAQSSASGTASLLKEWGPYDLWCVLYAVCVVRCTKPYMLISSIPLHISTMPLLHPKVRRRDHKLGEQRQRGAAGRRVSPPELVAAGAAHGGGETGDII